MLKILKETGGIGITAKQISKKLGIEEETVKTYLQELKERKAAIKKGRGLWIHGKYEDITNIHDFNPPQYYTKEFESKYKVFLREERQNINFSSNFNERIHRWAPYIQGFSSSFVNDILDKHEIDEGDLVLDPMSGNGTVLVCAKERGIDSIGVELMPLMAFVTKTKTEWGVDIKK